MEDTYPSNAKVCAALRVDGAGLEEGLARRGSSITAGSGHSDGSEGHDGGHGGFEELHFEKGGVKR